MLPAFRLYNSVVATGHGTCSFRHLLALVHIPEAAPAPGRQNLHSPTLGGLNCSVNMPGSHVLVHPQSKFERPWVWRKYFLFQGPGTVRPCILSASALCVCPPSGYFSQLLLSQVPVVSDQRQQSNTVAALGLHCSPPGSHLTAVKPCIPTASPQRFLMLSMFNIPLDHCYTLRTFSSDPWLLSLLD